MVWSTLCCRSRLTLIYFKEVQVVVLLDYFIFNFFSPIYFLNFVLSWSNLFHVEYASVRRDGSNDGCFFSKRFALIAFFFSALSIFPARVWRGDLVKELLDRKARSISWILQAFHHFETTPRAGCRALESNIHIHWPHTRCGCPKRIADIYIHWSMSIFFIFFFHPAIDSGRLGAPHRHA